ncbi:MAG: EAL domain-containing protein [Methylophagaceae bacterium]
MLQIKGTFLESKVARRMFLLFIVSALLPILILSVFSIRQINSIATQNIEHEVSQSTRSIGRLIYERLILLNEKLVIHFEHQSSKPIDVLKNTTIRGFAQFHIFSLEDSNYLEDNKLPTLSSTEQQFLLQGKPILITHFQKGLPTNIYLLHIIEGTDIITMGLIENDAIWGDPDTFDLSKGFCIYGSSNKILFCSQKNLGEQLQSIKSNWSNNSTGNLKHSHNEQSTLVSFWQIFLQPRYLYTSFTIVVVADENDALAPVSGLTNIYIAISLLAIAFIAFLSTIQIRRYLTPLEELMRGIKRISNNDFSHPVTVKTDDEFNQLAESFNSMSKRLSHQFEFLTTMAEIDQHILSNITIKDILSTLINQGNKAAQSETMNIAMLNKNTTELLDIFSADFHHVHGISVASHPIQSFDIEGLHHQKTAVFNIEDTQLPSYLKSLVQPPLSQFVIVPVLLNKTLAAILIFGFREQEFSQETHFRLRELGDRFAIALEKSAWEKKLYQQAHHDPLTQLPNRQLLNDRLQQAIKRSIRDESCFSVMFIDLDRFKTVNDSLGHSSGDQLLKIVSQRLIDTLRDDDTVARLGGDEFIIFLSPIDNHDELYSRSTLIANKVLAAVTEPYSIDNQEVHISTSLGIASFPSDGQDVETLIKNADSAMYHAKEQGRNNFQFYSKSLNEKALQQLVMDTDLHHAIENNEFQMYYQAKVETQSGKILGAEALIRWNHPEKGLVPPYQFIAIAEDNGLIKVIGEWTINEACRQNKLWQQQGLPAITVSVNLSPAQFQQDNLVDIVEHALDDSNLDAKYLDLEILEGSAMDDIKQTIKILNQFKDLGISISIDDYGTGYSTLSYLKHFPIDNLKIDRGFILDSVTDSGDQAIIASTILLAHKLGMNVVAEGVENDQQLALLQNLGCDEIQGYYFSRPIPADDFAKLLEKGSITASELTTS